MVRLGRSVPLALFTAVCSGVLVAVHWSVVTASGIFPSLEWGLEAVLQGFCVGAVAGLVPLVEALGLPSGHRASRVRRSWVAAVTWLLAAIALIVSILQALHAFARSQGASDEEVFSALGRLSELLRDDPAPFAVCYLILGMPLALGSLARTSGLRRREQLVLAVLGATPLAAAIMLGTRLLDPDGLVSSVPTFSLVPALAVAQGVTGKLGDVLFRPRANVSSRAPDRALTWGVALGLLFATPGVWGLVSWYSEARRDRENAGFRRLERIQAALEGADYDKALELCRRMHAAGCTRFEEEVLLPRWLEAAWVTGESGPPPDLLGEHAALSGVFADDKTRLFRRARYRLDLGDLVGAGVDLDAALSTSGQSFSYWEVSDVEVYVLRAEVNALKGDSEAAWADLRAAALDPEEHPDPQAERRVRELLQKVR